ncbi:hypothetical protein EHI8A_160580 [Entamoeba histolytica HM-1:IMSS-B]|uniref:Expansin-like EG45 domain-containing protein n=6 Tax=Entamoeba histolytica TaxID=5759 RepID=C4MAR6_ENTH1|nr:hypothetical protein, conserved [Entamoeba histolytica HM-1:IMSS]EMD47006.1 Hypothetical protein EHI5A_179400 [Entamoeba histolytica KU27]EMH77678.1 hypothetical protein EHI8A_160580 [Entamoeba histolytica HM-1:IMSS-B]EMS12514.1 hypothetical protein KM1_231900 [Entamoeba histolytica HM-3:IMSS]ENY62560.1 hypothetical protein EHI7A_142900 [Entamoeba histolytica HM-1:IMSS-A]GAT98927.1 hypothetical protein conserved [Entamoeba histolytica]|eukprot:XP_649511.1 hypothetical protein, conserved [Entamoeba histolytica HM-1:IMSS]
MNNNLFLFGLFYIGCYCTTLKETVVTKHQLIPLSECTKARVTHYDIETWNSGTACSFGEQPTQVIPGYMFGGSLNEAFFDHSNKCGICYEVVGPKGTVRFRADNKCAVQGNEKYCSGDMHHFDLVENTFTYVTDEEGISNVTFRMVACDYTGNLKLKTYSGSNNYFLEFVVHEHTLGITKLLLKDNEMKEFVDVPRSEYNTWRYGNIGRAFSFPVIVRVYSIAGTYVTISVTDGNEGHTFEADGNFKIPNNKYFDIDTLEMIDIPNGTTECCSLMEDDYSTLYKEGDVQGTYRNLPVNADITLNDKENPKNGEYCLKADMNGWGLIQLNAYHPAQADQYTHLHFFLKSKDECSNCFNVQAQHLNSDGITVSTKGAGEWTEFKILLTDLGITNNEFWGFRGQNMNSDKKTFWLDDVELIKDPNAPDAGKCYNTDVTYIPDTYTVDDNSNGSIPSSKSEETTDNSLENEGKYSYLVTGLLSILIILII